MKNKIKNFLNKIKRKVTSTLFIANVAAHLATFINGFVLGLFMFFVLIPYMSIQAAVGISKDFGE